MGSRVTYDLVIRGGTVLRLFGQTLRSPGIGLQKLEESDRGERGS
jgi:hypothetical protein